MLLGSPPDMVHGSLSHRARIRMPNSAEMALSEHAISYNNKKINATEFERFAADQRAKPDLLFQRKVLRRKGRQLRRPLRHPAQRIIPEFSAFVIGRYNAAFFTQNHAGVAGAAAPGTIFTGRGNGGPVHWLMEHNRTSLFKNALAETHTTKMIVHLPSFIIGRTHKKVKRTGKAHKRAGQLPL